MSLFYLEISVPSVLWKTLFMFYWFSLTSTGKFKIKKDKSHLHTQKGPDSEIKIIFP